MSAERVLEVTFQKCLKRFESFSKIEGVQAIVVESDQIEASVNRRSEIFLYGVDLTLRFQLFYSDIKFQKYLKSTFDNPTEEHVRDFFNEVCNLTLGKMKEVFTNNKIIVALSLPVNIQTSVSRILASRDVLHNTEVQDFKKDGESLFYAKVSAEIHKESTLANFQDIENSGGVDDGDIQFF